MTTELPADVSPDAYPSAAARWRAVIDDIRRSGLKHAEFCACRGLSLHTSRKYLYGSRPAAAASKYLPITPPSAPIDVDRPGLAPDPLVLILDGRRRIAVAPGFDAETLRRLKAERLSHAEIARRMGIGRISVRRILRSAADRVVGVRPPTASRVWTTGRLRTWAC